MKKVLLTDLQLARIPKYVYTYPKFNQRNHLLELFTEYLVQEKQDLVNQYYTDMNFSTENACEGT